MNAQHPTLIEQGAGRGWGGARPNSGGVRPGAGAKASRSFRDRYQADPDGSTVVRLSNRVLAYLETLGQTDGVSALEYLSRQEVNARSL